MRHGRHGRRKQVEIDEARRSPAALIKGVFLSKWIVGVGLALVLASPVGAQEMVVGPVYFDAPGEVEVLLELPGEPGALGGLPPLESLTLLEDGRPTSQAKAARTFGESERGTAYVVALDASKTMSAGPLRDVRRALLNLIDQAGPEDRIAVVTFADDVRVESTFGASKFTLQRSIENLTTRGRITELYKALFQAMDLFAEPDLPERRRLLIISDGKDEGEAYNLDDVVTRARSLGVAVDAIGLTRIDERYLSNLDRLARLSGGRYARATDSGQLSALIDQGRKRLAASPLARFELQELSADGRSHRLGVRMETGGRPLQGEVAVPYVPAPEAADVPGGGASPVHPVDPTPPDPPSSSPWWKETIWLVALGGLGLLVPIVLALVVLRRRRAEQEANPLVAHASPASAAAEPPLRDDEDRSWNRGGDFGGEAWPGMTRSASVPYREAAATRIEDDDPGDVTTLEPTLFARPDADIPLGKEVRAVFPSPAPGAPAAVLLDVVGKAGGGRVAVEANPFWIGSETGADLTLPGDAYVSGFHAALQHSEGTLYLYDNSSTNGTFVNGERLGPVHRALVPGDEIRVGRCTFVVRMP